MKIQVVGLLFFFALGILGVHAEALSGSFAAGDAGVVYTHSFSTAQAGGVTLTLTTGAGPSSSRAVAPVNASSSAGTTDRWFRRTNYNRNLYPDEMTHHPRT